MFVLQSKYERLLIEHHTLLLKWNNLVREINAAGGWPPRAALSKDDIKRLLMLCHPDKHDGKHAAVEMTQKLLALRETI